MRTRFTVIAAGAMLAVFAGSAGPAQADKHGAKHAGDAALCTGFGPQTPRDIDAKAGGNARVFTPAPAPEQMNLCNIHFHKHAEHRAAAYSVAAPAGPDGAVAGYMCNGHADLSKRQLRAPKVNHCQDVQPGDTIEVHWVYTSCDVAPGAGLGSCRSDTCANPQLRVEAQVFLIANDGSAQKMSSYDYAGAPAASGYHQPKALPDGGEPVTFLGSTTGPKYSEATCSPLQVSWSVRPECGVLDISSLSDWCQSNAFDEDHGHGVRALVTSPELLSPIP